jgi:RNA-directed DNA polymerase
MGSINSGQRSETADGVERESEGRTRLPLYALYDKISREDILAHAYAQCRSNKGAPGVDRQDFEAVEAYGLARWLGELALALRQETYRPDPIRACTYRRPTANSGRWASQPCGIGSA